MTKDLHMTKDIQDKESTGHIYKTKDFQDKRPTNW